MSICIFSTEQDIDGSTLLHLTESMVSRLLPTMKAEIDFMGLQKSLNEANQIPEADSASTRTPVNSELILSAPSPSTQQGFVQLCCYSEDNFNINLT